MYQILKIPIFWFLWVILSDFGEVYFRRNHVSINTPLACFLRIHCNHRRWQALLWRGCHSPLCFELLPKKYKLRLNSKNRFRSITSATAGQWSLLLQWSKSYGNLLRPYMCLSQWMFALHLHQYLHLFDDIARYKD